jgi:vitamin B12 transporter
MNARTPFPAAFGAGLSVLVAFLAILSPALPAQDARDGAPPVLKHDVVVTATRLETPERKVGSSLTVISGEELRRAGKAFVLEALESVLGLSTVRNGGPGAASAVFVRGAGSEHTLVLLDGLELNDPINPSRSCDLAHLALVDVERVEVLRGPQGLLYGSDALGGVVNIITRTGRGRPRLSLGASAGSLRSLGADLSLSGSGRRTDYALSLVHERAAGLSAASSAYAGNTERDGYRNSTLAARFGWTPRPSDSVTLTVRAVRDRTELDNFGGPGGDDPNNVQDYGSLLVRGQYRGLAAAGRWERLLSVSWLGSARDSLNPFDEAHPTDREEGAFRSGLVKIDWQNNLFLGPAHTLTAGLEIEEERGRSEYVAESAWGPSESAFPAARARSAGAYALDHWEAGGRFFVTAGIRAETHSLSGAALTFRVAPAFLVPATGTRLKASFGTGFKSPSLYQLHAPATSWGPIGNPGLRPERAAGWDAGLEQRFAAGRVVLGLTAFGNDFRDLVDFDTATGYVNIGRARTRGLEASLEARPSPGLRLAAAYTRLSARDLDAGTALVRRPRDRVSADLGLRLFRSVDLAVSGLWTGRRFDRDYSAYPAATVVLAPYLLLDAVVSAPAGPRFTVFARVSNILGARYETVWGYGTPGRTVRAGLRLAL